MIVYLNGQFLPEEQAMIPVTERGFLYGDGVFETMRLFSNHPFRWEQHWRRLEQGAAFIGLQVPLTEERFHAVAVELAHRNAISDAMLRLTVAGGSGPRGYARPQKSVPTVLATLSAVPTGDFERPEPWRLVVCSSAIVSSQRLSGFKTCNRLVNILARTEAASKNAEEALLLSEQGEVAEGGASNVFWWIGNRLCTPALGTGALPGVTRSIVLELCQGLGISAMEQTIRPEKLPTTDGVFLSLSSSGIVAATSIDGHPLAQNRKTEDLQRTYANLIKSEVARLERLNH